MNARPSHRRPLVAPAHMTRADGASLKRHDPLHHNWHQGLPLATRILGRCTREKRRLPPPPHSNVMYHESRYKTVCERVSWSSKQEGIDSVSRLSLSLSLALLQELCRQFEELGDCEYGDRCLFAHGMEELKHIPFRHPKFKTER